MRDLVMNEVELVSGGYNEASGPLLLVTGIFVVAYLAGIFSESSYGHYEIVNVPGEVFVRKPRCDENGRHIEGDLIKYTVPEKRWVRHN